MKRLVLLGGGHAQIQAIAAFGANPPVDTEIVLLDRSRYAAYSGMLPGLIAGHYSHAQAHIDLQWLCAQAGIAFVEREVCGLDLDAKRLLCTDGASEPFDLLSIDTGSAPPLEHIPGAAEHAHAVKPIDQFLPRVDALMRECCAPGAHAIALVGGGAAGFEVLLALAYRFERQQRRDGTVRWHWITDTAQVLPEFSQRVRRAALRIMARRGIEVHTHARVERATGDGVELAGGTAIPAAGVIWATGAAPAKFIAASGIETDARGFIAVDPSLRSLSHDCVFATGDVAAVLAHPRPKAGVFAVRQGPALTANLRLALAGRETRPFVPQTRFLVMLSAGERYAIATKFGLKVEGRWVWRWKDRIDRGFIRRFQPQAS
jgi:selenide,water dikinase